MRVVQPGLLVGGQPTKAEFEILVQAGFATLVNLRTEAEPGTWDEESAARARGLVYVSLPVPGEEAFTEENAAKLFEILSTARRPLLVHCRTGNRAGALFAIRAARSDRLSIEEAIAIGEAAGLAEPEVVRRILEELPPPEVPDEDDEEE